MVYVLLHLGEVSIDAIFYIFAVPEIVSQVRIVKDRVLVWGWLFESPSIYGNYILDDVHNQANIFLQTEVGKDELD